MEYRKLNIVEIEQLKQQMCTCDNWSKILVRNDFSTNSISSSHFSGQVKIGAQNKTVKLFGGIIRNTGIYNSTVHNCEIGNNCYINYVKNHISNYDIGNDVIINNVQLIANEGISYFGNGQKIAVLDESGGREIMMYDKLSAQLAYIMTLYRYRPKMLAKLEKLILEYTLKKANSRGLEIIAQ